MKQFSFPKSKRLVGNSRFKVVLACRTIAGDELLVMYAAKNDCGHPRLGVSIGKDCGDAVVRNRLKRLLREAFRQNQNRIPADLDYVVMISPRWIKKQDKQAIKKAVKLLAFRRVERSLLTLAGNIAAKMNPDKSG